jgi:anaerobic magnesium-protoporphyrin IX monomethyl ester cyclase
MIKNGLNILLIAPRYVLTDKAQYSYAFPLGIAYISAVLKKARINVTCLNINHYNGSTRDIVKTELDKKKYDVVATGHIGMGYPIVEEIFKAAKEHISKPKIILGGAIITSEPRLMFESLKPDFGVLGEGEETILELLNCIEKKKDLRK